MKTLIILIVACTLEVHAKQIVIRGPLITKSQAEYRAKAGDEVWQCARVVARRQVPIVKRVAKR